jgi:hypothetical protein
MIPHCDGTVHHIKFPAYYLAQLKSASALLCRSDIFSLQQHRAVRRKNYNATKKRDLRTCHDALAALVAYTVALINQLF